MIPLLPLWGKFRDYVTLGLLGVSLVCGAGWYITNLRLDACEANTDAIVARTTQVQAEATTAAIEDKNRIEQEYRERAEQTDAELADVLARYNASLVRYANRSTSSGTPSPAPSGSPAGVDGPSESPVVPSDVITIPFVDAEICAENTARLQLAREWALGLQEVE